MNKGNYGFPKKTYEPLITKIPDGCGQVVATSQILEGDLVVSNSAGFGTISTSVALGGLNLIPSITRAGDYIEAIAVESTTQGGSYPPHVIDLGGGAYAYVHKKNDGSQNFTLTVINSLNAVVGSISVSGGTYSSADHNRIADVLPNGDIAICDISSGYFRIRIFSQALVLKYTSTSAVFTAAAGGICNLIALPNGNVAGLFTNYDDGIYIHIMNGSTGSTVAASQVASVQYSGSPTQNGVMHHLGSNRLLVWSKSADTNSDPTTRTLRYRIYDASGTAEGAITNTGVILGQSYDLRYSNTYTMPNGHIWLVRRNSSDSYVYIERFSSSITYLGTINTTISSNGMACLLMPSGYFYLLSSLSSSGTSFVKYNHTTGGIVKSGACPSGWSTGFTTAARLSTSTFVVSVQNTNSNLHIYDEELQFIRTVTTPNAPSSSTPGLLKLVTGDIAVVSLNDSTSTASNKQWARLGEDRRAILGVAMNSAEAGNLVTYRYSGSNNTTISVPLRQDWGINYLNFDSVSRGGCKGIIQGYTAILKGV